MTVGAACATLCSTYEVIVREPGPTADHPLPRLAKGPWPMVGRGNEFAQVVAATRSASTCAVVLRGASGIGKSRLAAEAAGQLARDGWATLSLTGCSALRSLPLGGLTALLAEDRPALGVLTGDPLTLLDHASRSAARLARGRRLLLVVDDVSRLDALSTSVLCQLLHAGLARLVATVRQGDPVPEPLLRMWAADTALSVTLGPLLLEDTAGILAAALGEVAGRTAAQFHTAAGGNPLFLRELVLGALGAGVLVQSAGVWQLTGEPPASPELRDLVLRRLQQVEGADRDVLERVALCQPLPVDELPHPRSRAGLAAWEAAGLVEVSRVRGRLQAALTHPQYVAAVCGSLSELRIVDVLLEQADLVRTDDPADAVRAATWRLRAGQPAAPDLLFGAARGARLVDDHAEAARLAQAAVDAGGDFAEVHLLHAEALRALAQTDQALAALERAESADAAAPGPGELSARIATTLALARADAPLGTARALAGLAEAERQWPGQAGAFGLTRSLLLLYDGRAGAAAAEIDRLRAGAGPGPDDAQLDLAAVLPLSAVGRAEEAVAAAGRAVAQAGRPGVTRRAALAVEAAALLEAGRPDSARQSALGALHEAVAHDDEIAVRHAEFMLGRCCTELGLLQSAGRWFRDVVSGAQAKGRASFAGPALGALALTLLWRGDPEGAGVVLARQAPDTSAWDVSAVLARAWLAGGADLSELLAHAARYESTGYRYLSSWLLFGAARLGAAAQVDGRLAVIADGVDSPLLQARAAHATALVAARPEPLEAAGREWERQCSPVLAAEAYAAASRAAQAAGQARTAARLRQRVRHLLEAGEGASTPALHLADTAAVLTPREREITALATAGSTSRQIATRLHLSVRTVDNHLQSAYAKLGVSGRSELAAIS